MGIVGRNGAGKSTLLKLLSRVTAPTHGQIQVRGRMASLLEVGTGFHPELTGRENIYLNGAILGMNRRMIDHQLDAIIDFSGCEKYVDTPVKRYSSGMYVRLAFAVAAHLEPDILIVDEVLAVGDAEFQKKCIGKLKDVAEHGRTVLFVSHNMASIQHLCSRGVLMNQGGISNDGPTDEIVAEYLQQLTSHSDTGHIKSPDGEFVLTRTLLTDIDGALVSSLAPGQALTVRLDYESKSAIETPYFWVCIRSKDGTLAVASMLLDGFRPKVVEGSGHLKVTFPNLPLLPQNTYFVSMGMRYGNGDTQVIPSTEVGYFNVTGDGEEFGFRSEILSKHLRTTTGLVIPYRWEHSDGAIQEFKLRGIESHNVFPDR